MLRVREEEGRETMTIGIRMMLEDCERLEKEKDDRKRKGDTGKGKRSMWKRNGKTRRCS